MRDQLLLNLDLNLNLNLNTNLKLAVCPLRVNSQMNASLNLKDDSSLLQKGLLLQIL